MINPIVKCTWLRVTLFCKTFLKLYVLQFGKDAYQWCQLHFFNYGSKHVYSISPIQVVQLNAEPQVPSPQTDLVLILSIPKGWKVERTLPKYGGEPP